MSRHERSFQFHVWKPVGPRIAKVHVVCVLYSAGSRRRLPDFRSGMVKGLGFKYQIAIAPSVSDGAIINGAVKTNPVE